MLHEKLFKQQNCYRKNLLKQPKYHRKNKISTQYNQTVPLSLPPLSYYDD